MKQVNFYFALVFSLIIFSNSTFAQSPITLKVQATKAKTENIQTVNMFEYNTDLTEFNKTTDALADGQLLTLQPAALQSAMKNRNETFTLVLPMGAGESDDLKIDLVLHETITDDFTVITSSSNEQPVDVEPGLHYRGIVRDANNSLAAISIFDGELMGVITTPAHGNMVIGKTGDRPNEYIFFKEKDLLDDHNFSCGADNSALGQGKLKQLRDITRNQSGAENSAAGNCVNVYLECEHNMFLEKGSVANTVNHMTGLFNMVATLYQNENITTKVSQIFVWDTPDSYPTNSTIGALQAFRTARPNYNGDLAHLVSRGAPAGGGVAWVNALCTNYGYAYSYIYSNYSNVPTYSWSVSVLAHEMGHNLGSPHTHACSWNGNNTAIDGCGPAYGANEGCNGPIPTAGTIMSYCHLLSGVGIDFNLGFGQQPGDRIRNAINTASCLSTCGGNPPCNLTVSANSTNATNGNNGTATAAAANGTTPYGYVWNTGSTAASIANLAPGTYTVTATDGAGCTATGSATVLDLNSPTCNDNEVTLTLRLDNYPTETSWEIVDANGTVVASGGNYAQNQNNTTITEDFCLVDGCYDFNIYDTYGDGICCSYGQGNYALTDVAGNSLASGGQFASSETTNFCFGNTGGGCQETTIANNSFEIGWGIWTDGGIDSRRHAIDAPYALGTYCIRLRDNTSTSVTTTQTLDLSTYQEVTIDFSYYARSMDNSNEDFWFQVSTDGGASYQTLATWARDIDFNNDTRYYQTLNLTGVFGSNVKFRFRCDASGNYDWVYLDNIKITGCSNSGSMPNGTGIAVTGNSSTADAPTIAETMVTKAAVGDMVLFPNPVSEELNISIHTEYEEEVTLTIFDATGQLVRQMTTTGGESTSQLDASELESGYYFIRMEAGKETVTKKFVVLK